MGKIKLIDRYNFFVETLIRLSMNPDTMSDDDINYNFEEIESDVVTFLHENTLIPLLENNIISKNIVKESLVVREQVLKIPSEQWKIKEFKNGKEWSRIQNKAEMLLNIMKISKRTIDSNKFSLPDNSV